MTAHPVLVAIDPVAHPEPILEAATTLAAALKAPLAMVHVLPLSQAVDPDVLRTPAAHPAATAHLRAEEAAVLPALKALAQGPRDAGVATSLHMAHGDAAHAVLTLADQLGARLVVVGTHGRSGVLRAALGSVAESVVRHAAVPVVTVRQGRAPVADAIAHREIPLD